MTMAIHKIQGQAYNGDFYFDIPVDAQFLAVAEQQGQISIWYLTDPETTTTKYTAFKIVGTGVPIDQESFAHQFEHLGTVVMNDGAFVWHVFKEK